MKGMEFVDLDHAFYWQPFPAWIEIVRALYQTSLSSSTGDPILRDRVALHPAWRDQSTLASIIKWCWKCRQAKITLRFSTVHICWDKNGRAIAGEPGLLPIERDSPKPLLLVAAPLRQAGMYEESTRRAKRPTQSSSSAIPTRRTTLR